MFPNELHVCLHTNPVGEISMTHQEKICLTQKHQQCPLFLEAIDAPIPAKIGRKRVRSVRSKRLQRPFMLAAVAVLAVGSMISMVLFRNGKEAAQPAAALAIPRNSDTATATTEPWTPTPTPSKTASPSATRTATIRPTATATESPPTPGPALETPFGNFILHRVQNGESLVGIAALYQISIEQIEAANILRDTKTVWPEDVLVIPLGADLEPGLRFLAVLMEADTDLAALAEEYGVTVAELREYNRLGGLDWVPAGRWLIIPVAGE